MGLVLDHSVDKINSMDVFRICLLKPSSLFGFQNKRMLIILFPLSIKILASIVAILSKRVCL